MILGKINDKIPTWTVDSEKYNTKNNLQQISCLGLSKKLEWNFSL